MGLLDDAYVSPNTMPKDWASEALPLMPGVHLTHKLIFKAVRFLSARYPNSESR